MSLLEQTSGPEAGRYPLSARLLINQLDGLACGELELITPQAERLRFAGPRPGAQARLRLHDWGVCRAILAGGDIGLGAAYRDGRWSTDDLRSLLLLAAQNADALAASRGHWLARLLYRLRHLGRANTRRGSRDNIHAHYDLGNAFYRLWLDPTMTYSAALYEHPEQDLAEAQEAKYERILSCLEPRVGDRILEIGCGWGGFAEYAARTRGVSVDGITLSTEQLDYARRRAAAAGLDDRCRFSLTDYRDVGGRYDAIVSIEMLEAVGEAWWPTYFRKLHDTLRPGGRAVIQVITIADRHFAAYRRGSDFIQQYIFPGGMLPSPGTLERQAEAAGLFPAEMFSFGQDYAETLHQWLLRFDAARAEVAALGFDEGFQRLWRFYLAYCEAGFRTARTDVVQLVLCKE